MKKFVLDTNVLLENPQIINELKSNHIIVPLDVVGEVDKHKRSPGELGANARTAAKLLDKVNSEKTKNIVIHSDNLGITELLKKNGLDNSIDNRIAATAMLLKATLISNDVVLRVKARALKVAVIGYESKSKLDSYNDIYSGIATLDVSEEKINKLYSVGHLDTKVKFYQNQYILIRSEINPSHSAIGRFVDGKIVKIQNIKSVSGVKPRNMEQTAAVDAILDTSIDLVTLLGRAGTGKTAIALSAALEMVLDERLYDKILLMKSPISVGKELGFLPGTLLEKLGPFLGSYMDNLEFIFNSQKERGFKIEDIVDNLVQTGQLEFAPPAFMRGRSIARTIIILDEAQNLSRHEIKTIATRLGEKSKLIVMGDVQQIDTKVDSLDNGFTHLIEAFKEEKCAAHVTFTKNERSSFADLASEKL